VPWAPDYTTLAAAKAYLRIDDTVDDVQLAVWITAASRAIDRKTNRQFGSVSAPVTRIYRRTPYYDPGTGLYLLEIDDLIDSTGLTINGVAYASAGGLLLPDNAGADGKPYERIGLSAWPTPSYPGAPVTYSFSSSRWGWSSVPKQVEGATWLQLSRWSARRDSPLGVAGSPEQGSEMRLLSKLDPDVATTLAGLGRRRRAG
jgi:Phage gp6-like head-tail connector protein